MSFLAVSAGVGAAGLIYSVGKGISQDAKAKAIEKSNVRPTYQIPAEYQQNVNIAKQMAQIGMPQQQYNNQVNAINQNQAGAIAAQNNSANPGANLASIVRQGNAATGNLNAQDAAAKQNNQRFAIGQNGLMGQQKLAQQQYNNFDKYTENFNQAQAYRGAANANFQNGVNGASQLAGGLYGMGQLGYSGQTMGQMTGSPKLSASGATPAISNSGFGAQPVADHNLFSPQNGYGQSPQYNYGAQWGVNE